MTDLVLFSLLLAFIPFFMLWLLSIKLKDASIVDIYWGPSFGVTALITLGVTLANGIALSPLSWLAVGLTVLWGGRLGIYLWIRNVGHGEDWRYQNMRANRPGKFVGWSLYGVFGLQWGVMAIVSLPVVVTIISGGNINLLAGLGIVVFAIGFLFEAIGDYQLTAFKNDPTNSGKVMNRGLWAWTRHPNYFGNAALWWGLGLIAVSAGHWWTLVGPAVMTYFLVNISGKAMLERKLTKTREGYEDYLTQTSGFFPLPPKKTS